MCIKNEMCGDDSKHITMIGACEIDEALQILIIWLCFL